MGLGKKMQFALLAPVLTLLTKIISNQETIMSTQAQDDADLKAGVQQIIADEAAIKQGIADLSTRVSNALQNSSSAGDPVVEQAIADLNTLHAAMSGDQTALAAIVPTTPAPTTDAPAASGEVPIS